MTDAPAPDAAAPDASARDAFGRGALKAPESPEGSGPPNRGSLWLIEILKTLGITLLLFLGIQAFLAQPYQVEQTSMQATLQPGQYVLVDKVTPRFGPYRRGDIVVFQPPPEVARGAPFIKRVIGVAGDTVQIRQDGRVYVNGTVLDEPYIFVDDGRPTTMALDRNTWRVETGELFVLGDHRNRSDDSRVFGVIRVDEVVGRAFVRYWPIAAAGILSTPRYASLPDPQPTPTPGG